MKIQLQFSENSTPIQWKFNFNSMKIQLQFNENSTWIQWKFNFNSMNDKSKMAWEKTITLYREINIFRNLKRLVAWNRFKSTFFENN